MRGIRILSKRRDSREVGFGGEILAGRIARGARKKKVLGSSWEAILLGRE
jgi:hypothetical protein